MQRPLRIAAGALPCLTRRPPTPTGTKSTLPMACYAAGKKVEQARPKGRIFGKDRPRVRQCEALEAAALVVLLVGVAEVFRRKSAQIEQPNAAIVSEHREDAALHKPASRRAHVLANQHQTPPAETTAKVRSLQNSPLRVAADLPEHRGPDENALVPVIERPNAVADAVDKLHYTQSELRAVEGKLEGTANGVRVSQCLQDGTIITPRNHRVRIQAEQHIARGFRCRPVQGSRPRGKARLLASDKRGPEPDGEVGRAVERAAIGKQ